MSANLSHLNIAHWNIAGMKHGEKLENSVFINFIIEHDIVCLSETHCGEQDDIDVLGYNCFKLCRKGNVKNGRFFGGIAVYVKNELRKGIRYLTHSNDDYIWIELDKTFFNLPAHLYLCYAYIPPENSSYYKKRQQHTLNYIEKDLIQYSSKGNIMLLGDINARTGSKLDFIENDEDECNHVNPTLYESDSNIGKRNSQDSKCCSRGNKLLDICIGSKLRILNGRSFGDSLGYFTCHKHNGSSVVDYAIISEELLNRISNLLVGDYNPILSDHCNISLSLKCNQIIRRRNILNVNQYMSFPLQFKWSSNAVKAYQIALMNDKVATRINEIITKGHTTRHDIEKSINDMQEILLSAAKNAHLRKKNHKTTKVKDKKWYDRELKRLKYKIHYISSELKRFPYCSSLRRELFFTLSTYNKKRKKKCRRYRERVFSQIDELRTKNPSEFWNLIKSLDAKSEDQSKINIPIAEWELHYKKLNTNSFKSSDQENLLKKLEEIKYFCDTDRKITEKEVANAIKKLKMKKASGLDGILNEMIIYSQHAMTSLYAKMFNNILITGFYPSSWKNSYILPLHKGGDKSEVNNYRGISITSNLSKVFNSILNERLTDFIFQHDLISENQFGFKKKSRTSDNIFILKTLIDKHIGMGQKLYACFIDLRKAFDNVNHFLLMIKLRKTKVGSMMYDVIKDMYLNQDDNVQVKIGNFLSNKFSSSKGVRQGDTLSPLLFNFYINEIFNYISASDDSPVIGSKTIDALLYADDLVLFSTSKNDLQKKIQNLELFCEDYKMDINTSKSKVMVFNKTGKKLKINLKWKDEVIESTQTYKYLGLLIHCNGRFTAAQDNLSQRAAKGFYKLRKIMKGHIPSFTTCMHLFDSIIKPILSYGSDIWGCSMFNNSEINFKKLLGNTLEKCHQTFLKFAMGLNRRTPLIGLYGESGRFPLIIHWMKCSLRFVKRFNTMDTDSLLYECFQESQLLTDKNAWWSNIKCHIAQGHNPNEPLILTNQIIDQICTKYQNQFKHYWKSTIFDDSKSKNGNKLRHYRTYKNCFKREEYLDVLHYSYRSAMACFRLSSHRLAIEIGRQANFSERVEPEKRFCKYCSLEKCENELHFLSICPLYNELRDELFQNVYQKFPFVEDMPDETKYLWLMANLDSFVLLQTSKYIFSAFKLRENSTPFLSN